MSEKLHCGFCGRENSDQIVALIGGVTAFICDTCVDEAAKVVAEARFKKAVRDEIASLAEVVRNGDAPTHPKIETEVRN